MNVQDALKNLEFELNLGEDEMIMEAIIVGKVTRMSDGRMTVMTARSQGMDIVTQLGLVECLKQITDDLAGGWHDTKEDNE